MNYRRLLFALLAALFVLRVAYIAATPFDLSPDEAHYWEWSRRLDLSYYSKGPLVAWVIALFTSLLGDGAFAVRAGAVAFSTGASYLAYLFGRDAFGGERPGLYSALAVNALPLFSIGSILMTTDVLLVFFWLLASWLVLGAVKSERPALWYAAGAAAGLGFLAKYTMALFFPCVLAFLALSGGNGRFLRKKEPYVALLVAAAVSSPVFIWNLAHSSVTFRHTWGQVRPGEDELSLASVIEFIGSQAALVTPLLFVGVVYGIAMCAKAALGQRRSGGAADGESLAFFTSAPLLAFFILKSLFGKVQANWAAVSYATAIPAAVWAWEGLKSKRPGRALNLVAAAALAIGALVGTAAYFPWAVEAATGRPVMASAPFNRVVGWKGLGRKVTAMKLEMEKGGPLFIMSDSYQTASELAFYVEGKPVVYNHNAGTRRMNQYDLWPGFGGLKGHNAIYVRGGDAGPGDEVAAAFERCDGEPFSSRHGQMEIRRFTIHRCFGFKGMAVTPPENRY